MVMRIRNVLKSQHVISCFVFVFSPRGRAVLFSPTESSWWLSPTEGKLAEKRACRFATCFAELLGSWSSFEFKLMRYLRVLINAILIVIITFPPVAPKNGAPSDL